MEKSKKLNELFAEWEVKKNPDGTNVFKEKRTAGQFIRDGIVCEEEYDRAPFKVLFILKDVDDKYPEITYTRGVCDEVLKNDKLGETWSRIGEWSRGLLTGNVNFVHANELKKEAPEGEKDGLRKYFKKVAIMNLKKASGESVAKNIDFFTQAHCSEISQEIKICAPDLIITCGTFTELKNHIITRIDKSHEVDLLIGKKKVLNAEIDGLKTMIVEYRHPNRSGFSKDRYDDMVKIRREFFRK